MQEKQLEMFPPFRLTIKTSLPLKVLYYIQDQIHYPPEGRGGASYVGQNDAVGVSNLIPFLKGNYQDKIKVVRSPWAAMTNVSKTG